MFPREIFSEMSAKSRREMAGPGCCLLAPPAVLWHNKCTDFFYCFGHVSHKGWLLIRTVFNCFIMYYWYLATLVTKARVARVWTELGCGPVAQAAAPHGVFISAAAKLAFNGDLTSDIPNETLSTLHKNIWLRACAQKFLATALLRNKCVIKYNAMCVGGCESLWGISSK